VLPICVYVQFICVYVQFICVYVQFICVYVQFICVYVQSICVRVITNERLSSRLESFESLEKRASHSSRE